MWQGVGEAKWIVYKDALWEQRELITTPQRVLALVQIPINWGVRGPKHHIVHVHWRPSYDLASWVAATLI